MESVLVPVEDTLGMPVCWVINIDVSESPGPLRYLYCLDRKVGISVKWVFLYFGPFADFLAVVIGNE